MGGPAEGPSGRVREHHALTADTNLEICFQKVELEQRSKTPVHRDIDSTDQHAEVERLVALGATVKERFDSHTWMLDPESNDFCVMNATDR